MAKTERVKELERRKNVIHLMIDTGSISEEEGEILYLMQAKELLIIAGFPTNAEIMDAIHKEEPVEPTQGFENAMMKQEFVSGFLTGVGWMIKRELETK